MSDHFWGALADCTLVTLQTPEQSTRCRKAYETQRREFFWCHRSWQSQCRKAILTWLHRSGRWAPCAADHWWGGTPAQNRYSCQQQGVADTSLCFSWSVVGTSGWRTEEMGVLRAVLSAGIWGVPPAERCLWGALPQQLHFAQSYYPGKGLGVCSAALLQESHRKTLVSITGTHRNCCKDTGSRQLPIFQISITRQVLKYQSQTTALLLYSGSY